MKVLRSTARVLFACAVLIGAGEVGTAWAQSCLAGCPQDGRACLQRARVRRASCRVACQQDPFAGGGCLRRCQASFRTLRGECRTDFAECIELCNAPDAASCGSPCGRELAACARGAAGASLGCARDCRPAADKAACLGGCADEGAAAAAECAADFDSCLAACDPGLASTSPPKPPKPTSGKPSRPGVPTKPSKPSVPSKPSKPSKPSTPSKPSKPSVPAKPSKPGSPDKPSSTVPGKPPKPPT